MEKKVYGHNIFFPTNTVTEGINREFLAEFSPTTLSG